MGYSRLITFGNKIEKYEYEKDYNQPTHRKRQSKIQRKRRTNRKIIKSSRSIKRSRDNFFRLVHHNNVYSNTVHLITLTFACDVAYISALKAQTDFIKRLKIYYESKQSPISYISVPELTKKGRWHFHILVYGLPSTVTKWSERQTRNIQRIYRRGYVHLDLAADRSPRIAGYMAKYLAKSLSDQRPEAGRSYNCSRNIKKIASFGTNQIDFIPNITAPVETVREYETKYLGICKKTVYNIEVKNKDNKIHATIFNRRSNSTIH